MQVSLIVAMSQTNAIGKGGQLLWHLPNDLKYFKEITMGKPIVMGRTTYESIGKPLPGRTNIILSNNPDYVAPGCVILHNKEAVFDYCQKRARNYGYWRGADLPIILSRSNNTLFNQSACKLVR